MTGALKIPTIFTAVDRMSGPVQAMSRNVQRFSRDVSKDLTRFATAAGIAGGIFFSINAVKAYETSLQSFRTIVSDLTDNEFEAYRNKIFEVAAATKRSSTDVAQSFEKIAGLNASFAETAEGLGAVSKAAVVLSKASRMELGTSAESLVGIMNQFSLGALEADRTINVLAAGQAVGAANIQQTAEAFVNAGSTLAGANVTLEQSVGLLQTLGKFSLFGAEAGTKLRGAIIKLQKAGVGYASGQFNINDALTEAKGKLDKLSTAKAKDAKLNDLFGAENITAGRILLNNIGTYQDFTKAVTGTSEAQKAAEINSSTLATRLEELQAAWVNTLTSNTSANIGLSATKSVLGFVADNMGTLAGVAFSLTGAFIVYKTVTLAAAAATWASNAALGVQVALGKASIFSLRGNAVAMGTFRIATGLATAAQWLLNAALAANPITLIAVGILAAAAACTVFSGSLRKVSVQERVANQVKQRTLDNTVDQRVEAALLFQQLRKSAVGSQAYSEALRKIEAMQPGITSQYGLQVKSLEAINKAEKDLTGSILKRAEAQARAELLSEKMKELIKLQDSGPGFWDKVLGVVGNLNIAGAGMAFGAGADALHQQKISDTQKEVEALSSKAAQQSATNEVVKTNNSNKNVTVDFKNVPKGVQITGDAGANIMPGVSSTMM